MRCAECSTSNPLDHKYCKECGTPLDDGYRSLLRQARAAESPGDDAKQEKITSLLDMAFWHNESGHLDAAVKACEAALSLHADNTTAHSLLGTLYEKKGDDAAAITHLERVVALNPDSSADAVKLDQLTRGVHVRATAPPPVHRWIPPALSGLRVPPRLAKADTVDSDVPRGRPLWLPLVGASVAAALVLGTGMAAMRENGAGTPAPQAVAPVQSTGAAPQASAILSPRTASTVPQNVAPVTLAPGTSTGRALSDIFPPPPYAPAPVKSAPDPFAGHVPTYAAAAPFAARPVRVAKVPRVPGNAKIRPLPPLSLSAVPLPGEGIAPAAVSLPPAAVSLPPAAVSLPPAAVSSVPQHTVVVSSLGAGAQTFAPPASSPHIKIVVNKAADNGGGIVLSNNGDQITTTFTSGGTPDGARFQQSALNAQQNGNYKEARSWYAQAIRAYRAQIAAGRDPDTARAGLAACQTGLSICSQNPL